MDAKRWKSRAARVAAAALLGSVAVGLGSGVAGAAPITTTPVGGGTDANGLGAAIDGVGVVVSGATYTGANAAGGLFAGAGDVVGLDSGIVLSSGAIAKSAGPNSSPRTSTAFGLGGSSALDGILGATTYDASSLEVTFTSQASTVYLSYVFASEEYEEFVGDDFTDGVAVLVNGTNCAKLGSQPVSVDTVNDASNVFSYRDNETINDAATVGADTQADGFTKVLTCVATVTPDVPSTLEIVIADTGDDIYDSWVFVGAESLTTSDPRCFGLDPTIVGTNASETIEGTPGNDIIVAGPGDDVINGNGGLDALCGSSGEDTINGNPNADILIGGPGADQINGFDGDDIINGLGGIDTIDGGGGNDYITGSDGADQIDAGPGNDRVLSGPEADVVQGGLGNDTIDGGIGTDLVQGGDDDDDLQGFGGVDTIDGGPGTDTCNDKYNKNIAISCELGSVKQ